MLSSYKRKFLAILVGAFLLLLAFPLVASADAAVTSFNVDRTSINPGQAVTFTLRTSYEVNYVFSDVDGNRVQASRQSANTWQLVVSPNVTQNITIIASETDSVNDAAMVNIPITVEAEVVAPPVVTPPAVTTPAVTQPVTNMPAPPLLDSGTPRPSVSSLAIISISETPALRAGYVQLTVITGEGTNYVWVQFDGNRYRLAQEQRTLRTETTRTWVVNFRPSRFSAQSVQVSSNREYSVVGAHSQNFNVEIAAPFVQVVPDVAAVIQSVSITNRSVVLGGQTSFSINTNADVNYVWLVDMDGGRREARLASQTATRRTWSVTFNPQNSGQVRIYASIEDRHVGAVVRRENITVRQQNASILSASASVINWGTNWNWQWQHNHGTVRVEVTTNQWVDRVWVELPGGRGQRTLSLQSGSGSSNRVWTADINELWDFSTLQVYASQTSSFSRDASRSVSISGWSDWWGWHGHGWHGSNWMGSGWVSWSSNPGDRVLSAFIQPTGTWTGTWNDGFMTINTLTAVDRVYVTWGGTTRQALLVSPGHFTVHMPGNWWGNNWWNTNWWTNNVTIRTWIGSDWRDSVGVFGW